MTVSAAYDLKLKVTETPALGLDFATDKDLLHHFDSAATLSASSTVPATKVGALAVSLSGGAATLDLTSITHGSELNAVTFSGLKVQLLKVRARSTNTDTVTIVDGASNGYNIFGDASGQITLSAGMEALFFYNEALADVSGSAKTIDFSSSDADAIVDIIIVAG